MTNYITNIKEESSRQLTQKVMRHIEKGYILRHGDSSMGYDMRVELEDPMKPNEYVRLSYGDASKCKDLENAVEKLENLTQEEKKLLDRLVKHPWLSSDGIKTLKTEIITKYDRETISEVNTYLYPLSKTVYTNDVSVFVNSYLKHIQRLNEQYNYPTHKEINVPYKQAKQYVAGIDGFGKKSISSTTLKIERDTRSETLKYIARNLSNNNTTVVARGN